MVGRAGSTRILVGLIGAVLLAIAACGGGSGEPEPSVQVATLEILSGSVEVGAEGAFSPGTEGQELHEGDTVRTGPDGRAAIGYFDGSVTRLDRNTSFTIVTLQILGESGSTTIEGEQDSGNTYNRVAELTDSESRFDVQTPTAIASVQGTVYAVIFNADGSITFAVVEGTVIVTAGGESIEVPAGFMVTVDADGNIGDLVPIPEDLLTGEWIEYNLCELDEEGECPVDAALDHIEISPASSTIAAGESQDYTVEAFDQNGQSMGEVTDDVTITGEGCSGSSCAPSVPGEYEITGEFMGLTDTATLTVEPGPVDAIEISPESATVQAGQPQAFTAEGFDAFGNSLGPVDASYSMLGGSCTDAECSSEDVGEYTVTGTFEGTSDTAALEVTVGPLSYILVSPSIAEIEAGGSHGFSARGYDQFGNPRGAVAASFSITNGACDGATCGSTVAGAQTVTGVFSGRADTAELTVLPGPMVTMEISPENATIQAGETQAYSAAGFDQYGNSTGPVDADYDMYPVEALGLPGGPLAAAFGEIVQYCFGDECGSTNAGFYEVEGSYGEFLDYASLQVEPGPAANVELYPTSQLDIGDCDTGAYTFTAYVVDAYGNVVDVETDIDFVDADGGSEVTFDPPSGTVTSSFGSASVDVYANSPGSVELRADVDEFGLSSNVVTFDVYACIGFSEPGDGGTLLFALIGLLAVPGLVRLHRT